MSDIIQLPHGDLWRAPVQDAEGNNTPRPDTVSLANLPQRGKMTPDVAAILMAELEAKAAK